MTKLQRMLTSLIAVVPAALLVYELVKVLLTDSERLTTLAYIMLGITLVAMVVTLLIPVTIMVGGSRKSPAATKAAPKSKTGDDIEALDDDVEVTSRSSGSFDAQDVLDESSEYDLGNSDQDMVLDSEVEIDTEPVEDFELDDEEEELPKPKKKKR